MWNIKWSVYLTKCSCRVQLLHCRKMTFHRRPVFFIELKSLFPTQEFTTKSTYEASNRRQFHEERLCTSLTHREVWTVPPGPQQRPCQQHVLQDCGSLVPLSTSIMTLWTLHTSHFQCFMNPVTIFWTVWWRVIFYSVLQFTVPILTRRTTTSW